MKSKKDPPTAYIENGKKSVSDFVSGKHLSHTRFKQICRDIIHDFDRLPIDENLKKPKVGIVGEILVKFLPAANNHLARASGSRKVPRLSFRIC